MATAEVLRYNIVVDGSQATDGFKQLKTTGVGATSAVSAGFGAMLPKINPVVAGIAAAAAAAVAIGKGVATSIKEFSKFEAQIANVYTLLDGPPSQIKKLQEQVMKLPNELGKASEMADALYDAVSAGVPDNAAVNFIRDSAIAAKAGLSDVKTAVGASTSVLNSFGLASENVGQIYDEMFVAVKAGKTTFGELASSIGKVAPIAKVAGLTTKEMFASISALTKGGLATSEAVTSMKQVMVNILKPTKQAAEEAERLGLAFDAKALKDNGFLNMLKKIQAAAGDDAAALTKLFGSAEAFASVAQLVSDKGGKDFEEILNNMGSSSGEAAKAFGKQADTIAFKWETLQNTINKMAVTFGEKLQPAIKPVLDLLIRMAETGIKVVAWIGDFIKGVMDAYNWLSQWGVSIGTLELNLTDLLVPGQAMIKVFLSIMDAVIGVHKWIKDLASLLAESDLGKSMANFGKNLYKIFASVGTAITDSMTRAFNFIKIGFLKIIKFMMEAIKSVPGFGDIDTGNIEASIRAAQNWKSETEKQAEAQEIANRRIDAYNKAMKEYKDRIAAIQQGKDAGLVTGFAAEEMQQKAFQTLNRTLKNNTIFLSVLPKVDENFETNLQNQVKDFLLKYNKEYEIVIDFKGSGSSTLPLSEKIKEMAGKLLGFGKEVDSANPELRIDFKNATGQSLSTALDATERGFNNMFDNVINGTMSVSDSFQQMASDILSSVGKMLASQAIKSLVGSFGNTGTGEAASGLGKVLGSLFGGGLATGGTALGGRTHIVGENGPELFTPGQTGRVTPNNKLGGMGGGLNLTNNITINRSGGAQDDRDDKKLGNELSRMIADKVKEVMATEKRPGGMLNTAQTVGR
jgi:TP901 family phage tail tape measure protein